MSIVSKYHDPKKKTFSCAVIPTNYFLRAEEGEKKWEVSCLKNAHIIGRKPRANYNPQFAECTSALSRASIQPEVLGTHTHTRARSRYNLCYPFICASFPSPVFLQKGEVYFNHVLLPPTPNICSVSKPHSKSVSIKQSIRNHHRK